MKWLRLRNKFLKANSCIDRKEHKKQCKYVVILLRKGKKNCYINFDISKVTDNRAFWKIVKPKISDKVKIVITLLLIIIIIIIITIIIIVVVIKFCPKMLKLPKLLINFFINIPILNMPNNKVSLPKHVLLKKIVFQE